MPDDRLDRLIEKVDALTDDVTITQDQLRAVLNIIEIHSRDNNRLYEMANDTRKDIQRLYAAWPDHLRDGH